MKITILNQHSNNFGDEAAGISLIDLLNKEFDYPEINLIYNGNSKISCDYKNVIHRLNYSLKNMGYFNIIMKLIFHNYKGNSIMNKFNDLMKKSDYIFVAPCGANIGIYKDWRFIIRILFAIFNKKTPIFYLNTIGKSGNYLFDRISKYILKKSKVYVREKESKKYLESIGIKCELGVDTAFLFNYKNKNNYETDKISFIVTDISKHKNFKGINGLNFIDNKILPDLCYFAKKNNMTISVIPHLNTSEELEFIKKIVDIMNKKYDFHKIILEKVSNVYDYYDKISSSLFVVGMRYHAIVLGAKSNTPFVSLAYENKMVEVSSYLGLDDYNLIMYKNVNLSLLSKLDEVKKNNSQIRKHLEEINEKLIELAKLPLKELDEYEK